MAASVSQMIQASTFLGSKVASVARATPAKAQAKFVVSASSNRPVWFPGNAPRAWLDGSLPGDFGYDPLGLSSDPQVLKWMVQAELQNARWAMLGVAGMLGADLANKVGLPAAVQWYEAPLVDYQADWKTLLVVQLVLHAWVEGRRWADFHSPGSANADPFGNSLPSTATTGYPGGPFDPLGFSKGNLPELKLKEIKNGRLAMVASLGLFVQYSATGASPLDNLAAHLADPGHANIFALDKSGLYN
uniref:Chlorophyll a-b binding protein, chloroplastic n=3 Tax=Mesostigma viride TaxID=41882 RepID=A0A7S4X4T0_MESVI